MKKLLLSIATLALGATAFAGVVKFDFTANNYGLTPYDEALGNNSPYVTDGEKATNGDVVITLNGETDKNTTGWRVWNDGLREYNKRNPSFTVSTTNGEPVTYVAWKAKSGAKFVLEGTDNVITSWSGNESAVTFTSVSTANAAIQTLTVGYGGYVGEDTNTPAPESPTGTITVTEALSLLNQGYTGPATVEGIVSKVGNLGNSGAMTYWISADGSENNQIQIYYGYGVDGAEFTSATDVLVGAKVVVEGNILMYNGTTPEFDSGSKMISYNAEGIDVPDVPGPSADIITVSEAIEIITKGYRGEATVKGIVSQVGKLGTSGGLIYYISDDGTTNNELEVYYGYGIDGANFTSENDVEVGASVVVKGTLTLYGSDTYEFSSGSELLEYEAPEGGNGGNNEGDNGNEGDNNNPEVPENAIFSAFVLGVDDSYSPFSPYGDIPEGLNYVWTWDPKYGAKASAFYNNTTFASEAWLACPNIDLTGYSKVIMTFEHAINKGTGDPKNTCKVYVGETDDYSMPSTSWNNISNQVTYPEGVNWDFVNSGEISLNEFAGKKIRLAFLYNSTSEDAPQWEIKNLVIDGVEGDNEGEGDDNGGVEGIEDDINTPVVYYNLQGLKVANPVKGQIYIANGKKVIY